MKNFQDELRKFREAENNLQKMRESLQAEIDRMNGSVDPANLALQGTGLSAVANSQPTMPKPDTQNTVRFASLNGGNSAGSQSFAEHLRNRDRATSGLQDSAASIGKEGVDRYGYTPYKGRASERPLAGTIRKYTHPVHGVVEQAFNGSAWETTRVIKSREQIRAEGRARHDVREQFFANQQNRYDAAGKTLKTWNSLGRDGQYFERRAQFQQHAGTDIDGNQIMPGYRSPTGTEIAHATHIDNAVARGAVPMHRDFQGNNVYIDNPFLPRPTAGGRDRGALYRAEMGYTPEAAPSGSFSAKAAELKREIADANRAVENEIIEKGTKQGLSSVEIGEVLNGSSRMDRVTGAVGEVPFGPRMKITGAGNTPPVVIELWNAENPRRNFALRLNPKTGQFRLSDKNDETVRLLTEQGLIVTSVAATGSYDVYIQGTKDGSWKFRACNSMDRWSGTETLTVQGSAPARAERTTQKAIDNSKKHKEIFEEPKRDRIQKEAETGVRQPRAQHDPELAKGAVDELDNSIRALDAMRDSLDHDTYVAQREKLSEERRRWLREWEQKQVQVLMRLLRNKELEPAKAKAMLKQIEDAFPGVHGTDANPLAAFRSNNAMQLNRRDIPFQLEIDTANSNNEKLRLLFRKNDGWRTGRKPVE